jgi:hypothetical protein
MKLDRVLPLPPTLTLANLPRGRSITGVKEHNLQAILSALLRYGPISRVEMARLTGLSSTTITNLVTDLLEQGIVEEAGKLEAEGDRPSAGRPRTLIRLIPDARCAVGIHIGVDTVRVGVTDLFGALQAYRIAQQPENASPPQLLTLAVSLTEEALAESGKCRECLVGIGVGASA